MEVGSVHFTFMAKWNLRTRERVSISATGGMLPDASASTEHLTFLTRNLTMDGLRPHAAALACCSAVG